MYSEWIRNKLTVIGDNAEEVIKSITTMEPDEIEINDAELPPIELPRIDLNKIIPMPSEMNIDADYTADLCVSLYLTSVNPNIKYYGKEKLSEKDYAYMLNKGRQMKYTPLRESGTLSIEKIREYEQTLADFGFERRTTPEEAIAYGKRAVDNLFEHGFRDYENWRCVYWGCQFNARNCEIYETEAHFDTINTLDIKLLQILSEKYPNHTLINEFASHYEAGYVAGRYIVKDGKSIEESSFDDYSKDAYETFFEVFGREDEFVFDEKSGTYKAIDNVTEM